MSEKTTHFMAGELQAEILKSGRQHPVLVILDGKRTSRRFEVKKPEYSLGRDETCDMVLHDTNCSRVHAKLLHANFECAGEPPRVLLADQRSTNGCFVNGKKVDTVELRTGDKILVGKTLIGYFIWDDATLQAEDALLRSASTDGVTGLYNRGFFNNAIQKELSRAERYKRPASLVLVDVDRFKACNEEHGQAAGDKVLRRIAEVLSSHARSNDLVCRYGGDELAVILAETTLPGAVAQAKRMCGLIRELETPHEGTTLKVTASFGVSEYEPWMTTADHFIKAADAALYKAKRDGRDCVRSNEGYSEENAPTDRIAPVGIAAPSQQT